MFNYEEKLKEVRKTGKGRAVRFQEESNFVMGKNNRCPHCSAESGNKRSAAGRIIEYKTVNNDIYEIPSDIEYMSKHVEYSWTEDCICANCGKQYSQNNGC